MVQWPTHNSIHSGRLPDIFQLCCVTDALKTGEPKPNRSTHCARRPLPAGRSALPQAPPPPPSPTYSIAHIIGRPVHSLLRSLDATVMHRILVPAPSRGSQSEPSARHTDAADAGHSPFQARERRRSMDSDIGPRAAAGLGPARPPSSRVGNRFPPHRRTLLTPYPGCSQPTRLAGRPAPDGSGCPAADPQSRSRWTARGRLPVRWLSVEAAAAAASAAAAAACEPLSHHRSVSLRVARRAAVRSGAPPPVLPESRNAGTSPRDSDGGGVKHPNLRLATRVGSEAVTGHGDPGSTAGHDLSLAFLVPPQCRPGCRRGRFRRRVPGKVRS